MSPTCNYTDFPGPFISFFYIIYKRVSRIFILCSHAHSLSSQEATSQYDMVGQWAGKKSVEESLCNLPSKNFTLLIFSSHQCICSSLMSVILITLDTTFRSISPINISISSFAVNLLFLKHLRTRRRSLSFIFFCAVCVRHRYYKLDKK
jgi:hypothetical protein